jgi:hypothetical protein
MRAVSDTASTPEVSLTEAIGYFMLPVCIDPGTTGADIRLMQPDCLTGSNGGHLAVEVG